MFLIGSFDLEFGFFYLDLVIWNLRFINFMFEGLHRFTVQIDKLEKILNDIRSSKERALAFYQSPARQVLFYLESLTHLYGEMHNRKRFEKIRVASKTLEDQMGKIDYYDGFIKEFSVQKDFPVVLLDHIRQQMEKELRRLDVMLKKDGWSNGKMSALQSIKNKLQSADWKTGEEDRSGVGKAILHAIEKIKKDYSSGKLNFDDIEHGVHEFRRQIRWISIYAQAVDGLIQLKKSRKPDPALASYLTKEVLESPYNQLPAVKPGIIPINVDTEAFYALSWMIAESGRLKDDGLRVICLEDAIRATGYVDREKRKSTARHLAMKTKMPLNQIRKRVRILADKFIHLDKILDRIKDDIMVSIR